MRSSASLMDEFGAALQFFDDFGENWHALSECLRYLDEWIPADAFIVVITNAQSVLIDERPQEASWLIKVLNEVGEWWSRPITDNDRFNRPATPFHTVLQLSQNEIHDARRRFGRLPLLKRKA